MEEILARALKAADEAEVFVTSAIETPVQFETNRLKHIQTKQSRMVTLRVIKNGKTGYATTTRTDDVGELVDNAVATAEFGQKAEFHFPDRKRFPKLEIYDPAIEKVTLEQMKQLGDEMIAAVTEYSPEVLCEAGVTKVICELGILNSRGGKASFRQTVFALGIEGQLIRGTDMLFVGDHASSCSPILDSKAITRTVVEQLRLAKRQATVTTMPMPVIFTPDGVASALILPLMSAFNGKTVLEGASPIGGKLGQKVFDANLTLWDDPFIPDRPGSRPCDDEGVPCQRTALVMKGVVNQFLYDLQTAGRAKTKSTGNGRRGMGGLPSPSINALIVEGGKTSFKDMVKDIKEGLVVEQLMGAGQGNVLGGDFSGNVLLGFKIENGKIVGRVKDTMVSGNVYQLLKDITAIGSDSKWVGGALRTPSLYISNVSVASR
ncbi:MAG: metallopeptidase TldD-related protein [Dehalococcoidia bacterium]|nr:metallopeptidase TldD-related protein [Dehalococcoidia bacterium]